jgi:hypothetical protein
LTHNYSDISEYGSTSEGGNISDNATHSAKENATDYHSDNAHTDSLNNDSYVIKGMTSESGCSYIKSEREEDVQQPSVINGVASENGCSYIKPKREDGVQQRRGIRAPRPFKIPGTFEDEYSQLSTTGSSGSSESDYMGSSESSEGDYGDNLEPVEGSSHNVAFCITDSSDDENTALPTINVIIFTHYITNFFK